MVRTGFARGLLVFALALAAAGAAPEPSLAEYDRIEIGRTRTSIYVGRVTMDLPVLARRNGTYTAEYHARVFPYFFYNERGRFSIDVSDAALRQLLRGEPIDFAGEAISADGARREVTGRATPVDARSGRLKVRVFVTPRIQLIFNTTYRPIGPG